MKKAFMAGLIAILLAGTLPVLMAQTICENTKGPHGDYIYEMWKDSGQACMTLGPEGTFLIEWQEAGNLISRTGFRPGNGSEIIEYEAHFQPEGNAWMGVYGWTRNPTLEYDLEYYIIESWSSWRPPGIMEPLGTVESDGGTYDIYQYRYYRLGDRTYPGYREQYYSVRQTKRTSGTITVANHFNAWKALDMEMGKLYDVSFAVEAYQSSGIAEISKFLITQTEPTPQPPPMGDVNGDFKIDIIDALLVTQFYVGIPVEAFLEAKADVNQDGEITIVDALLIAQCYVGQVPCDF